MRVIVTEKIVRLIDLSIKFSKEPEVLKAYRGSSFVVSTYGCASTSNYTTPYSKVSDLIKKKAEDELTLAEEWEEYLKLTAELGFYFKALLKITG